MKELIQRILSQLREYVERCDKIVYENGSKEE